MARDEYAGRSLSFVRRIKGQPAKWHNANEAREASGPIQDGPPPLGRIAWYGAEPHGNVALGIDGGLVITTNHVGAPRIYPHDDPKLGEYLGWTRVLG